MLVKKTRIPVKHIVLIGCWPGLIKKFIYRLKGYKFGKNVKLSFGSVVIGKDVSIGDNSSIGFFTIVRADKIEIKRFVKIGAMSAIDTGKLFLDDDARINEQVYVGGIKTPESELRMGKRTIIMQASYINPTLPIIVGDDSGIGGHCLLFTHGSWNSELEGYPVKFAPITLGKKVWLPWRVFIMPGITIGDNVVIGANSLINKDIPSNSLAAGNPATVLKNNFPKALTETEKQSILSRIFSEFESHLKFNGFSITKNVLADGFTFSISGNGKNSVFVFTNKPETLSTLSGDNVLLTYSDIKSFPKGPYEMILSLYNNSRLGSSDVGEELTSFLSRYGIRFNRLD